MNQLGANQIPTAGAAAPQPAPISGRGIKPLVSLRAHRTLAIALAITIAVLGLPIAWVKGRAAYYTEAVVHVSPRFVKNLDDDIELEFQSNSQYLQYVQQQVRTINRKDIGRDAIQNLGDRQDLWRAEGESLQDAAKRLQSALAIRSVPDTYLITVGLEGPRPEGIAEVVNTVVSTYLTRQKSEEFYANDERIENLQGERTRLVESIQKKMEGRQFTELPLMKKAKKCLKNTVLK